MKKTSINLKFFHEFKLDPHCQWSEWVAEECSQTCGPGKRKSLRKQLVKKEYYGDCKGQSTKVEACNEKECLDNPG